MDLLPTYNIYNLTIISTFIYFWAWQIGFKIKVIIFIRNISIKSWIGCKVLLFGNLFPLTNILELFELISIWEKLYSLLLARFKSIQFINLEALTTDILLIYASYSC